MVGLPCASPCVSSCLERCAIPFCRGKLLNVRDANMSQIGANTEIQNLKQILGLQHGKVGKNASTLHDLQWAGTGHWQGKG